MPAEVYSQEKAYNLRFCARWDNDNLSVFDNQTFNDVWGWTSPDGREYAIIGTLDSTYFIEITDPYKPVVRDAEAGRYNRCIHRDYQTYKNYCCAVADEGDLSTLQIFDMRYLPDSVHKVYDSDTLVQRAHDIFIDTASATLYFADSKRVTTNASGGRTYSRFPMTVASLQDPEKPVFIANLISPKINGTPLFNEVHDLFVRNDTAYLNCGNAGAFIYNYKNKVNPKLITDIRTYPQKGFNHSGWLTADGNHYVFTDENWGKELKIYDVSDIKNPNNPNPEPEFLATFGSNSQYFSIAHNPFIVGNLVYVSYYHEGVVVFDISDPNKPVKVAKYDTYPQNPETADGFLGYKGAWGVYPFFPSGSIIASDLDHGLFVLRMDTTTGINDEKQAVKLEISVFPNPFQSGYSVLLKNLKPYSSSELNLSLTDALGREVWKQVFHPTEIDFNNDHSEIKINCSPPADLPKGIYFLKINHGKKEIQQVVKLVKSGL